MAIREDNQFDPFVEDFVLERLPVQISLRILFDVVPNIRFQNVIELISVQSVASNLAFLKRICMVMFFMML